MAHRDLLIKFRADFAPDHLTMILMFIRAGILSDDPQTKHTALWVQSLLP